MRRAPIYNLNRFLRRPALPGLPLLETSMALRQAPTDCVPSGIGVLRPVFFYTHMTRRLEAYLKLILGVLPQAN